MTDLRAARAKLRYPVRRQVDGDFTLSEILAHTAATTAARAATRPNVAEAALKAKLWRLGDVDDAAAATVTANSTSTGTRTTTDNIVSPTDVALLHAVETAPLWRPPVVMSTAGLRPAVAEAWLALAAHWVGVANATGDLRFLNTTCKLLGAVWARRQDAAERPESRQWRDAELTARIATVAQLIEAATTDLTDQLDARLVPSTSAATPDEPRLSHPPGIGHDTLLSIVVLAGAGSTSAARFIAAAESVALTISGLCWYAAPPAPDRDVESSYADAWYPPSAAAATTTAPKPQVPQTTAPTWEAVAAALRRYRADLVILLGMPIVPAPILAGARLGFLNAHNGALPHYRGMDAVAWAVLQGDPIVCSLHIARPRVDDGEVLATAPIMFSPAPTLRARIKTAQLHLLLAAAAFVADTGRLPAATRQPAASGRQYYRLHPHLKRVLDASSYAQHPARTVLEGGLRQ